MVYLEIDPDPDEPADVIGDEPIWHDGDVVGWVTSGAYAHHSGVSLAFGYVPAALAAPEGRRRGGSRSRSSGTADRRACSASPSSIRAVNECVRDGRVNDGEARRRPRRTELLDGVVAYLAERGIAGVSLRPMAKCSASA